MNSSSSLTEPLDPNDAELGIMRHDDDSTPTEQEQATQSVRRASLILGVIIGCLVQSMIVVWNVKAMMATSTSSYAHYYLDMIVLLVVLPATPFLFTFLLCKLIRQGAAIVQDHNSKEASTSSSSDKWEEVLTSHMAFRFIYGYAFGLLIGHLL